MKRSAIKIKVDRMLEFVKKWASYETKNLQQEVWIDKSISEYEANEKVFMALEIQELLSDLKKKQLRWKDLRDIVDSLPDRIPGEQTRFF